MMPPCPTLRVAAAFRQASVIADGVDHCPVRFPWRDIFTRFDIPGKQFNIHRVSRIPVGIYHFNTGVEIKGFHQSPLVGPDLDTHPGGIVRRRRQGDNALGRRYQWRCGTQADRNIVLVVAAG